MGNINSIPEDRAQSTSQPAPPSPIPIPAPPTPIPSKPINNPSTEPKNVCSLKIRPRPNKGTH